VLKIVWSIFRLVRERLDMFRKQIDDGEREKNTGRKVYFSNSMKNDIENKHKQTFTRGSNFQKKMKSLIFNTQ